MVLPPTNWICCCLDRFYGCQSLVSRLMIVFPRPSAHGSAYNYNTRHLGCVQDQFHGRFYFARRECWPVFPRYALRKNASQTVVGIGGQRPSLDPAFAILC